MNDSMKSPQVLHHSEQNSPSPNSQVKNTLEKGACEQEKFPTPTKENEIRTKPYEGMLFEMIEEAKKFYEDYGRQEGFWIRIQSTDKRWCRSNEVTGKLFVCTHLGKHVKKTKKDNSSQVDVGKETTTTDHMKKRSRSCSTVKCGCKASLRIMYDMVTCKWKVSVFNDDHNHKLVTLYKIKKMKSNRHMPKAVKNLTEAFQRENLQIGKVLSIFCGEHIDIDSRDC